MGDPIEVGGHRSKIPWRMSTGQKHRGRWQGTNPPHGPATTPSTSFLITPCSAVPAEQVG
jgi:hypothetical protein